MSNIIERTVEAIHKEYSDLCARAGHTAYQIKVLNDDLNLVHEQLKTLNLEAAAVQAKAKENTEAK